jgi:hypothetical protein
LDKSSIALVAKSPSYPLCKTDTTRKEAFNLLTKLCQDCPVNTLRFFCLVSLLQHREHYRELEGMVHDPSVLGRSLATGSFYVIFVVFMFFFLVSGYCGLYNPGTICYLNSFLQQLFMHFPFRYSLLSIQNNEGPKEEANAATKEENDSLVKLTRTSFYKPLQDLFAQLQESVRKFGETRLVFIILFFFFFEYIFMEDML